MAVRSALPWPFRWVVIALVFGFCAAIALWAFEFGKSIAGLDGGGNLDTVTRLQAELRKLQDERDQARRVADTAQTLVTAEKAAQEQLMARTRKLEADNLALRDDLGFFEQLMPASGSEGLSVRGLQAELVEGRRLRWRVLLIQPQKNAPEFVGVMQVSLVGTLNGKPWSLAATPARSQQAVRFTQFGRFQGLVDLPAQAMVQTVSVKVLEGSTVKATKSTNL